MIAENHVLLHFLPILVPIAADVGVIGLGLFVVAGPLLGLLLHPVWFIVSLCREARQPRPQLRIRVYYWNGGEWCGAGGCRKIARYILDDGSGGGVAVLCAA